MAAVDRSLVATLPMFAGLSPGEQDELLREARSIRYPKDTAVFDQGDEAYRFFVLLHGHLRVEKTTPQGQQTVVRYVSAGELFGVAEAMNLNIIPRRRSRQSRASHSPGHPRHGSALLAGFRALPAAHCRPSATVFTTPRPG